MSLVSPRSTYSQCGGLPTLLDQRDDFVETSPSNALSAVRLAVSLLLEYAVFPSATFSVGSCGVGCVSSLSMIVKSLAETLGYPYTSVTSSFT